MGRTPWPVPFFAVLLAPVAAGLDGACGWGGLSDRPAPSIQVPIEALAEYPSLPVGWKTGTAALRERRRRAARVPDVPGQGPDPAEPVNVPAVDW